jgi:hypothetical protein
MKKDKQSIKKEKKSHKILYWAPRVLSIIFILFVSMFALDIFGNGYTVWQTIVGLFMHLIPTWIMIIALVIAWKREIVGGVVFILLGLLYIGMTTISSIKGNLPWYIALAWSFQIAGPAIIVGVLWMLNWTKIKGKHIFKQ